MNKSEMLTVVLRYEGAIAAEGKLTDIANKEGDEALLRVVEHLSSAEISQVTAEGDLIKPSLLHTAISPEQFRGVFRRVGVKWSAAEREDCPPEILSGFQADLEQFFCAFILLTDDENRRIELLKVILDEPQGLDALVFSTIHEKDFEDFVASHERYAETGDWREVIGIIRAHFPESWERFKNSALITEVGELKNFVQDLAAEMYAVAVSEGVVTELKAAEAAELFTPLPAA